MNNPMTPQELKAMDALILAHDEFVKLEAMHPNDILDWVDGIHKCQNVIKGRIVARDYPEYFYNGISNKKEGL